MSENDKVDEFGLSSLTLYPSEPEGLAISKDVAPPLLPTPGSIHAPLKPILKQPSKIFATKTVVPRTLPAAPIKPIFREPFHPSWSSLLKYDNDAVLGAAPPAKKLRTHQDDGYRPHGRSDVVPIVEQRRSSRHHTPTPKFTEYRSSMDITLAMEDFPSPVSENFCSATGIDSLDGAEPRRRVMFNSAMTIYEIPTLRSPDDWYLVDETPSYDVPLPPDPIYKSVTRKFKRRQRLPPPPEPAAAPSVSSRGRHRTPTVKLNIASVDFDKY